MYCQLHMAQRTRISARLPAEVVSTTLPTQQDHEITSISTRLAQIRISVTRTPDFNQSESPRRDRRQCNSSLAEHRNDAHAITQWHPAIIVETMGTMSTIAGITRGMFESGWEEIHNQTQTPNSDRRWTRLGGIQKTRWTQSK